MKIYSDSLHKIAYATDASVYREIPYGVAYPETIEDVQELTDKTVKFPQLFGDGKAAEHILEAIVEYIQK